MPVTVTVLRFLTSSAFFCAADVAVLPVVWLAASWANAAPDRHKPVMMLAASMVLR